MNGTGLQGACLENTPAKYCSDVNTEIHLTLTPALPARQNKIFLFTYPPTLLWATATTYLVRISSYLLEGHKNPQPPEGWFTVWRSTAKMQGQPFKQLLPPTGLRPSSWASCFYFPDTWHWFPPFGSLSVFLVSLIRTSKRQWIQACF